MDTDWKKAKGLLPAGTSRAVWTKPRTRKNYPIRICVICEICGLFPFPLHRFHRWTQIGRRPRGYCLLAPPAPCGQNRAQEKITQSESVSSVKSVVCSPSPYTDFTDGHRLEEGQGATACWHLPRRVDKTAHKKKLPNPNLCHL